MFILSFSDAWLVCPFHLSLQNDIVQKTDINLCKKIFKK